MLTNQYGWIGRNKYHSLEETMSILRKFYGAGAWEKSMLCSNLSLFLDALGPYITRTPVSDPKAISSWH